MESAGQASSLMLEGATAPRLTLDPPPEYAPNQASAPKYTSRPRTDEQTLDSTTSCPPRQRRPPARFFELVQRDASDTCRLYVTCCQTEFVHGSEIPGGGTEVPVFARNAIVRGHVTLRSEREARNVVSVGVRMVGQVRLEVEGCPQSLASTWLSGDSRTQHHAVEVLHLFKTLFDATQRDEEDEDMEPEIDVRECPQVLPFRFAIPPTFIEDDGTLANLPPSYDTHITAGRDAGGLRAEVAYELQVVVIKRSRRLFYKRITVAMPFIYRPRTRPSSSPQRVEGTDLLAALKASPELWALHAKDLITDGSRSEIIIPKTGVFCLSGADQRDQDGLVLGGTIPIHAELNDAEMYSSRTYSMTDTPPDSPLSSRPISVADSVPPSPEPSSKSLMHYRLLSRRMWHAIRAAASLSTISSRRLAPSPISPSTSSFGTSTESNRQSPDPLGAASSRSRRASVVEAAASRIKTTSSSTDDREPRAYLVRHISICVGGRVRACGAYACGEGVLQPAASTSAGWEGAIVLDEVRLHRTPGFAAAGVSLEDFVVVAWGAGVGEQHALPVRLVTDPFQHHSPE
ncbi:hypothetical protein BKA62DRAFT_702378 [Auriculariales sp. MPI-PUGE-AT-0066]|nr:hypothetical protein BKA62DRAFT_702378 [Auriculariales sp. MPI-PUGE-AT-0066]